MPKAYFIGGAPRAGKSTLAQRLLKSHPMLSASTDTMRAHLRETTTHSVKPELFYLDSLNADEPEMARLMRQETASIIAAAESESQAVWPSIEQFARHTLASGHDVLIEGVAILPSQVHKLKLPHAVVYLGNQSPAHTKDIHEFAQNHPKTWLGNLQPASIDAFGIFCQAYSSHIQQQASKYRQPYIEMSASSFTASLTSAQNQLH